MSMRNQLRLTAVMAFASMAALLFSHLALTDIYNGEADQSLEWRVLQTSAVVLIAFIGITLVTLRRVLKTTK
jgi:hypothetical protein